MVPWFLRIGNPNWAKILFLSIHLFLSKKPVTKTSHLEEKLNALCFFLFCQKSSPIQSNPQAQAENPDLDFPADTGWPSTVTLPGYLS